MKAKIYIVWFCIFSTLFSFSHYSYCQNYNIRKKDDGSSWLNLSSSRPGLGRVKGLFRYTTQTTLPVTIITYSGSTTKNITFTFLDGYIYAPRFYGKLKKRTSGIVYEQDGGNLFIPLDRSFGFKRSVNLSLRGFSGHTVYISSLKPNSVFKCNSSSLAKSDITNSGRFYNRAGVGNSITLAVDIDSRFSKLHGRKALLAAVLALQKASNVYSSTFGYPIRISAMTQFTSSSSDPVSTKYKSSTQLLEAFRQYRLNNPVSGTDIYHLFTSQRGFIDAIGLAYIGTMCAVPEFAAGWSDYSSGFLFFAQTLMHELGHSLNASHDQTDSRSLMSVSNTINIINPYFSSFSISEVSSFISTNNSCFQISTGNQVPTPSASSYRHPNEVAASIKLSASLIRCSSKRCLKGKVTNLKNTPLSGRVIELLSFPPVKLLRTTHTDKNGNYKFTLSKRGRYYLSDRISQKTTKLFRY